MKSPTRAAKIRPILTSVLVIVLLALCWLGLEVYFALTATPNPVTDYGALNEQLVIDAQRDREGEDAWPLLIEATELMHEAEGAAYESDARFVEGEALIDFGAIYAYEDSLEDILEMEFDADLRRAELDMQRDLALETIARFEDAGVLARLDRVAASGRGVMPFPDTREQMSLTILLPHLGDQRSLAKALRARMFIASEAGDWETYTQSFEHIMAIGRLTGEQPTLIHRLVGIAIRSLGVGAVTEDIASGKVPADAFDALARSLERQRDMAPFSLALRSELHFELDAVQWTHTRRGRIMLSEVSKLGAMSGATGGLQGNLPKIANVASVVYPRQNTTEAWFREYNSFLIEMSEMTPAERKNVWNPVKYEEFAWNQPLQEMITPALGRAMRSQDQESLQIEGLRTMLAIEQYRRDQGELPGALSVLVPEYLESVPRDLFAPGEKPLRYVILNTPDAFGRAYLLYSVGLDGVDNEGTPHEKNAFDAISSASAAGSDFVLNRLDHD